MFWRVAETKQNEIRIQKMRCDLGLNELDKLGISPAVRQVLQKRLLAFKLKNPIGLEQELAPARASENGRWLQEQVIDKKVRLEEGMRDIAKRLRTSRGIKENQPLEASADQAILEATLLLDTMRNKPQLDAEFQRYRELVYTFHFYKIRCVYTSKVRNANLNKDEKKKAAEYRKVVANIVKVEKDEQTADFGGNEVKRLYRDLIDDDEMLKKAYVAEGGAALLNN